MLMLLPIIGLSKGLDDANRIVPRDCGFINVTHILHDFGIFICIFMNTNSLLDFLMWTAGGTLLTNCFTFVYMDSSRAFVASNPSGLPSGSKRTEDGEMNPIMAIEALF